ncbi:MAG: TVP38/TMEM64 family protein [Candidatus Babeliales bacterium]
MKITKRHFMRVCIAIVFLALIGVVKGLGLTDYLSLTWLQEHLHELHTYIDAHYALSVGAFIASYVTVSALSIPGSTLFITASGLLFGKIGFLYAIVGATLGAMVLFFVSRYLIGAWVQKKYVHKLAKFNHAFEQRGVYYLLFVRLLALLPFGMINALSGITLVRPTTFLLTTLFGMLPYIFLYTFAGMQLNNVTADQGWFSPPVLAFAGSVGLRMILLPFAVQHVLAIRREYKV